MRFDPVKRRYFQGNRELSPAEVRKHVDQYVTAEQKEVDREAKRLLAGVITLAAFFEFMREKVQAWHVISGVIAYGGQSQMDSERWARIHEKVQSELTYLANFEQEAQASFTAAETAAKQAVEAIAGQIPDGLETLVEERVTEALLTTAPSEAEAVATAAVEDALADSVGAETAAAVAEVVTLDKAGAILDSLIGATIPSRAAMYPSAAYTTFETNVRERERDTGVTLARRVCAEDEASCDECVEAATDEYMPLDEVSDIGSLTCMNNCRCFFEFSFEGVEPIGINATVSEIFA
jgi:hypothetical protein